MEGTSMKSQYTKGSNQYQKTLKKDKVFRGGMSLLGFAIIMVGLYDLQVTFSPSHIDASESVDIITSQVAVPAESKQVVAIKVATPAATLKVEPTIQQDVENYVKTIFGKDGKVAIAVSHVECNPSNKAYPKCVYHTDREYSVGIFQINLFNKDHMIHAAKVPGKTMEEKIEALKDPYINTLVAYKIYSHSGFNPWVGYTSGRYLDKLAD